MPDGPSSGRSARVPQSASSKDSAAPARRAGRIVRHGIARVLSRLGVCSRTQAAQLVRDGRVAIGARVILDPEWPCDETVTDLRIDGRPVGARAPIYVALNKPRGVVTTARDEKGRETVYRCFDGADLPWLAPVGRLDRASEGLLLFSNDPAWAARVTDPVSAIVKQYHVQIDRVPDAALIDALLAGVVADGENLRAISVRILRTGTRHGWLEIALDEGRNRQIRRMLQAHEVAVLRLVRVAIGAVALGELAKGAWRPLRREEVESLAPVRT
jgi:23S rRNA pseudouridine2605 synthase